jgi:hypothetical protein
MNPVMIDPVEEQPDVDIQHEDYPLNVLDLSNEPPNLDMDIVDDHQVVEQENLSPPQNPQPDLEENALPPEVIEPLDQQDIRKENILRRSDRIPKYSARYQEFRRSLGLTTLIGKLNVKLNICMKVN